MWSYEVEWFRASILESPTYFKGNVQTNNSIEIIASLHSTKSLNHRITKGYRV